MKKLYFSFLALCLSYGASAQFENFDFETWTQQGSYDDPDGWFNVNQFSGLLGITVPVERIETGAPEGLFAASLQTVQCAACPGLVGPGTDPLPGVIRQEQAYTLSPNDATFWYKYEGVGGDVGLVYIESTIWDATGDSAIVLSAAADTLGDNATWQQITIPFIDAGLSMTPDSIKINFLASANPLINDPNLPNAQVGSKLYVDGLYFDNQVGIEEDQNIDLKAFIAQNQLIITTGNDYNNASIELIDLTGKVIKREVISGSNNNFDVSDLPNGVYLVKLNLEDSSRTVKVIK